MLAVVEHQHGGYSNSVSDATAALPPQAAHAVEESAGAGFAVAVKLEQGGAQLAGAVRESFATGLGKAMLAGSVIALLAAGYTAWRAPRRSPAFAPVAADDLDTLSPPALVS